MCVVAETGKPDVRADVYVVGGHNEVTKEEVQSILRGAHRNHTADGVRQSHDGARGRDIEAGFLDRDIGANFLNRDIGAGCKCVDYDCGCCAYWRMEWSLVIVNERGRVGQYQKIQGK